MIRGLLSSILLLIATPIYATPPDTIYINENLFGISATHLYFLRTAENNLGLHIFGMKDTFLVAKNIDTGLDDDIWPVLRQHGASDYDADGAPSALIQTFPLVNAVNPFSILVERGALQIAEPSVLGELADSAFLGETGVTVREFSLDAETLATQLEHAVATTLTAIQPYPDDGFASMSFSPPQDLLGDWTVGLDQCSLYRTHQVSPIYGMRVVQLAQIECWDITWEQPAILYVILQPVLVVE